MKINSCACAHSRPNRVVLLDKTKIYSLETMQWNKYKSVFQLGSSFQLSDSSRPWPPVFSSLCTKQLFARILNVQYKHPPHSLPGLLGARNCTKTRGATFERHRMACDHGCYISLINDKCKKLFQSLLLAGKIKLMRALSLKLRKWYEVSPSMYLFVLKWKLYSWITFPTYAVSPTSRWLGNR